VRGNGDALQAPHINVTVFARGLLKQLATRIYFAGEPSNDLDGVLSSIADAAARRTLIAERESGVHRFDIVLQGPRETVFFDV
jgi:protocatechuate 3,4-dioxygenase alpha subunit